MGMVPASFAESGCGNAAVMKDHRRAMFSHRRPRWRRARASRRPPMSGVLGPRVLSFRQPAASPRSVSLATGNGSKLGCRRAAFAAESFHLFRKPPDSHPSPFRLVRWNGMTVPFGLRPGVYISICAGIGLAAGCVHQPLRWHRLCGRWCLMALWPPVSISSCAGLGSAAGGVPRPCGRLCPSAPALASAIRPVVSIGPAAGCVPQLLRWHRLYGRLWLGARNHT